MNQMKEYLFTFNFNLSLVQEPHAAREPRCGHPCYRMSLLKLFIKHI